MTTQPTVVGHSVVFEPLTQSSGMIEHKTAKREPGQRRSTSWKKNPKAKSSNGTLEKKREKKQVIWNWCERQRWINSRTRCFENSCLNGVRENANMRSPCQSPKHVNYLP